MNINERIQMIIEGGMERGETAGGAVLVKKDGKEVLFAGAGYADWENKKPYEKDTIFRAYSMSKPITSAAAMLLVERGQLDIGQTLDSIIPEYKDTMVWTPNGLEKQVFPMTIKDLFSMTSGLVYNGAEDVPAEKAQIVFSEIADRLHTDNQMTTVEFAKKMANVPLAFQPRSHYRYGTSADVMGAVIEIVSGMRFGEFLEKEFFEPLGMKDTAFWVPADKQDRLAKTYIKENGEFVESKTEHLGVIYDRSVEPGFESGGAGLVSTLQDYMTFADMLMNGGELNGKRILSKKTVELMTSPQLDTVPQHDLWNWSIARAGYNYGFFNRVLTEVGKNSLYASKGEYGWDGWLGTYYCNDPENKMSIVFASQVTGAGSNGTVRRLKNAIYGEFL